MSWWAVGGTRLDFESISWMLMPHCRIANQGRSSLSTASILTPLDPQEEDLMILMIWKVTSCQRLPGKAWNHELYLWHAVVHEEKSRKRLGIAVRFEKKTISSIVRNSPNRSREEAKFRILKVTIITPNCQLFGGDIHPSWVTYTSQEPSGDESPYAYGNYKVPKPSIHTRHAEYHGVAQKTPFNTSAEALSFLLQLLDRSFFRIDASGLRGHCGVTHYISVFQKDCYQYLFDKNKAKISIMSTSFHSTLVVYPHWNNQSCFPQGHCSQNAAACSSAEQGYKDLTHKNSQYMQTEWKSWKRITVVSIFICPE